MSNGDFATLSSGPWDAPHSTTHILYTTYIFLTLHGSGCHNMLHTGWLDSVATYPIARKSESSVAKRCRSPVLGKVLSTSCGFQWCSLSLGLWPCHSNWNHCHHVASSCLCLDLCFYFSLSSGYQPLTLETALILNHFCYGWGWRVLYGILNKWPPAPRSSCKGWLVDEGHGCTTAGAGLIYHLVADWLIDWYRSYSVS